MKDSFGLVLIKKIALSKYTIDLKVTRFLSNLLGKKPYYKLEGSCNGCGKCCESPTIQVKPLFFRLLSTRWLILKWHQLINGFELKEENTKYKLFIFKCNHYDPITKECDSYGSRPGMCRDYPNNLLYSPSPDFFEDCSYTPILRNAEGFSNSLKSLGLPPDELADLEKKLRIKE